MNITQTITLDLSQVGVFTAVNAKQGDDQTRFVRAVILNGGMVWQAPEGTTAGFRCVKPDGHSCQNPAVINDDGTVTVELTAQVLAVPGTVWADICFVNGAGEVLSTASFAIYVAGVPQGQNIPSSNEFLTLVDMVSRGEAVLAELGRAKGGLEDLRQRVTDLENAPDEGGVSSWEDLADRPFYDTSWGGTLDTTNGVPEPALYFEGTPIYFVCLAELTKDELLEGNVVISYRGETQSGRIGDRGTAFQEVIPGAPVYLHATQLLLVTEAVHIDNDSMTLDTVPGVYYAGVIPTDSAFVLTLSGGITQMLDPKFLPVEAIDARIDAYMEAALGGDY